MTLFIDLDQELASSGKYRRDWCRNKWSMSGIFFESTPVVCKLDNTYNPNMEQNRLGNNQLLFFLERLYENKNSKVVFVAILIIGLYFSFFPSLNNNVISDSIKSFFYKTKSTLIADIFFSILAIVAILFLLVKIKRRKQYKVPSIVDILTLLVISIIYVSQRLGILYGQDWEFIGFKSLSYVKYSDVIFLLITGISFNPRKKSNIIPANSSPLIEDNVYKRLGKDVFVRLEYARGIAGLINNQESENSFAIGITGNWGSGKSVFLNQIESALMDHCQIIKFNPWLSKQTSDIVHDFYNVIVEIVKPYDSSLSRKLRQYSNTLLSIEDSLRIKVTKFIEMGEINYLSLERQRNEIKENIRSNRLKLVVFIDDLDRLNSEEVLSVLSLIRNSFDFPNTFFFVAYDHDYVLSLLKTLDSPGEFLEKIFQLEIDLPVFPTEVMKEQLLQFLRQNKTESQVNEIRIAIDIIDKNLKLKSIITNLRGAVRFSNSINHIFLKKYSQLDLIDFMVLELVKLKSKKIYAEIKEWLPYEPQGTYLRFPTGNSFSEKVILFDRQMFDRDKSSQEVMPLLEFLFNRTENHDELKSIRVSGNFLRYFSDYLFGNISFEEFDVYKLENGLIAFKEFISNCIQEGKKDALFDLLSRINKINSVHGTVNFIKGIFFYCNSTNDYSLMSETWRLTSSKGFFKSLANEEIVQKNLRTLLEPDTFPYLSEAIFGGELLEGNNLEKDFQFSDQDFEIIRAQLKNCLLKFIGNSNKFDSRCFEIYQRIILSINENKILIDPHANDIIRDYIVSYPDEFLKSNIILKHGSEFVLHAYIDQYLGWDEFEKMLFSVDESFEILRLKSFYDFYKRNDFQPVAYDFSELFVVSDPTTRFISSIDYPNLTEKESVVTNRESKIAISSKFEVFQFSNWISRTRALTTTEVIKGGVYKFSKTVDLTGSRQRIKAATIYFLVDDYLILHVNKLKINTEFNGFESIQILSLSDYLITGKNVLDFYIRNAPGNENDIRVSDDPNPYEFIYNLIIEFELE